MAKLRRSQLKSIVKECLVEILAEGLVSSQSSTQKRVSHKARPVAPAKSARAIDESKFNNAVNSTVNQLTSDPLMAAIFEDTAKTTLQEQMSAETHQGMVVASGDNSLQSPHNEPKDQLDDLFGPAAQNWAALAFSNGKKNNLG